MPLRFLVVDDNAAHQRLMANVVLFFGGQFVTASSGLDVLERVKHEEFDIILMDLWMPGLGGIPTTARLLDLYQGQSVRPRIVAVTGIDTEDRRALCRAIGMDGFVSKPYEPTTLKMALQQVVLRGHCWKDRPTERLLNLDKLWASVPRANAPEAETFDTHAKEARRCLEILRNGVAEPVPYLEWVEAFARHYGFLRLRQTMKAWANGASDGGHELPADKLAEEIRDFEMTLIGAREAFYEARKSETNSSASPVETAA